ncbi:hypothetical protein MNBD_CHLOROFLEXI01-3297 [hydrothermal vent metagenome]|uniref:Uncharacterized protein n=1 Tax=hydrothermal vent metagenome TaxID=652676 RepID=A0A3B0VZ46_9ZZZZ
MSRFINGGWDAAEGAVKHEDKKGAAAHLGRGNQRPQGVEPAQLLVSRVSGTASRTTVRELSVNFPSGSSCPMRLKFSNVRSREKVICCGNGLPTGCSVAVTIQMRGRRKTAVTSSLIKNRQEIFEKTVFPLWFSASSLRFSVFLLVSE